MPTTIQALIILLLVVVPGYIFALTLLKSIANISTSEWRFLLTTLTLGAMVHAMVSVWTIELIRIYDNDAQRLYSHVPQLMLWGAITIFMLPVALGLGLGRLARSAPGDQFLAWLGFGYVSLLPSAWEYVFSKDDGAFVRVHLMAGGIVGGRFSTNSFASDPPGASDLYIEEAWVFDSDSDFHIPVPSSRGIWVAHDAIAYITFHDAGQEPNHEHDATNAEGAGSPNSSSAGHEGEPAKESSGSHTTAEDTKANICPTSKQ